MTKLNMQVRIGTPRGYGILGIAKQFFLSDLLHVRAAGALCGYGHGELGLHGIRILRPW